METLLHSIISFGLGLALLLALTGLIIRERSGAGQALTALFFAIALSLIPSLLHLNDERLQHPELLSLGKVAPFMVGPLFYFYFTFLIGGARKFVLWDALHFLPGLFAVFWIISVPGPERFLSPSDRFDLNVLVQEPLGAGAPLLILLYQFITIWRLSRFGKNPRGKQAAPPVDARVLKLAFLLLWLYTAGTLLVFLGMLSWHIIAHLGVALLVGSIAFQFIIAQRHPAFLALRQTRYERTHLGGRDRDELLEKLDSLMRAEKLYLDEELTLARLAEELGLTLHQISQLLNESAGVNFYGYINRFRIQAAQELLLAEPERTVLSIAYAVGFNSKSSFHGAFSRFTGMSPGEYRKRKSGSSL